MEISNQQLMLDAFHGGVKEYQPEYHGEALEQETGEPGVGVRNIKRLLKRGLIIDSIWVREIPGVLIRYTTGETYLASGLDGGVNADRAASLALVKLAVMAGLGTEKECLRYITREFQSGACRKLELPLIPAKALRLHRPDDGII